ncbi:MAG: NAD(P)-dependent oxidoreductase [bacterium]|nr:NAD(P)-dependent oxidoreductase [bacterium]
MKVVNLEKDCLGNDVDFTTLEQLGETTSYGATKYEEISERLKDAEIALINRCRMEEATLKDCNNLKLVCIMGTGTDMIDQEYMKSRNILVANVRDYSTYSVAQHTFAILFYVLEHLRFFDDYVKDENYVQGKIQDYQKSRQFTQLAGKTYGICGLGAIGRQVAAVATAFGAKVIYYSTSGKNSNSDYEQVTFEELLERSDIISIHAPLTEKSRGIFDKKAFERMKGTAILVNTGRGAIVKEEDLVEALESKQILGAALDVLCFEPMMQDSPLLRIKDSDRLFITPHIAWAAREARQLVIDEMCENMKAFQIGKHRNIIWE